MASTAGCHHHRSVQNLLQPIAKFALVMAANEDTESKLDLSGMQAQAETVKTGNRNKRRRFNSRDSGNASLNNQQTTNGCCEGRGSLHLKANA